MDFSLSQDDLLLQESVRAFVEEQANTVWKEIEKSDELPPSLLEGARDLGLLALSIPAKYGGLGLTVSQKTLVHEMLGRGPWGLSSYISVHTGIGCLGIVHFASEAQKERYLPKMASGEWVSSFALTEPQSGSDAAGIKTSAVRKGARYIVSGQKTFITNAPKAHHFFLVARTDKGLSAFIVDAESPGVRIGSVFDTIGHRGSYISEIFFEDAEIPADALVGEEGKGLDYAKRALSEGRTTLGARCVGSAQKAMELALEYAASRQTFGKPLADHQSIAFRLAQMSARTEVSRMACYRAAWLIDRGQKAIRESSTAKLLGAEYAWQTVDDAMQIFGGSGYVHHEYMIERIWRDLRVARVYDGSSEVQQIVIAQQLRKGDVQTAWR